MNSVQPDQTPLHACCIFFNLTVAVIVLHASDIEFMVRVRFSVRVSFVTVQI